MSSPSWRTFQAEVDAERATLRAAADAPTDLQAHEPSDSPAPATPRSSPAAAVHMPSSAASDDKVASALDECVEELVAACDNLALAPTADHAGATATCNSVRAALAGVVGSARAESPPTQASHPTDAVYVDACQMCGDCSPSSETEALTEAPPLPPPLKHARSGPLDQTRKCPPYFSLKANRRW